MREGYNQKHLFLMRIARDLGLPCFESFGVFYIFPNTSEFELGSEEFTRKGYCRVPDSIFDPSGE